MIVGSNILKRFLLLADRVPSGHVRILRRKTIGFDLWLCLSTLSAMLYIVTYWCIANQLLHEQLWAGRPVACLPLTPYRCCLPYESGQTITQRRIKERSVVFFFWKPGLPQTPVITMCWLRKSLCEFLHPIRLGSKHTAPTHCVRIWGTVLFDSRSKPWLQMCKSVKWCNMFCHHS